MHQTNRLHMTAPNSPLQWLQIYRLYRTAFPRAERKPFSMILKMAKAGKSDVWYCTKNNRFAGLAITINGDDLILLDYFAIAPQLRGAGMGSEILQALRTQYLGKKLFGEIESVYEECDDQSVRLRRKQFYINNGMTQMNIMVFLFGVKMELIGFDCQLTYEEYRNFYRDHYNEWAANHISPAVHPEALP